MRGRGELNGAGKRADWVLPRCTGRGKAELDLGHTCLAVEPIRSLGCDGADRPVRQAWCILQPNTARWPGGSSAGGACDRAAPLPIVVCGVIHPTRPLPLLGATLRPSPSTPTSCCSRLAPLLRASGSDSSSDLGICLRAVPRALLRQVLAPVVGELPPPYKAWSLLLCVCAYASLASFLSCA